MKDWAKITLVYIAGAVVFLWPMPLHLGDAIWGDRFDAWTTLWLIGHLAERLHTGDLNPITTEILYPNGYNLFSFGHAALQAIGAVMVAIGIPLVPAYNLLLIGGIASSGMGAHLLGKELTGNHTAGFLSGILFCTTPYLYGEGAAGCIELVAAGLMPLHAWALLRLARQPNKKHFAIATIILAIIGPFNWYYTLFTGMFAIGFFTWQVLQKHWKQAAAIALSCALAAALDAPLIPLVRQETPERPPVSAALFTDSHAWEASDMLADAKVDIAAIDESLLKLHDAMQVIRNSTQLRSLIDAGFVVNPLKSTPGRLIYIAALWAAWVAGRQVRGWLGIAGVATILTLGPFLVLDDTPPLPEWSGRLPLPYLFAYTYLPFFAKAYRPYRIGIIVVESVAAAAAVALMTLRSRPQSKQIGVALVGLYAITQPFIAGEQPGYRPLADARIPSIYSQLQSQAPGAVIEVPLQYQPLTVGNARYQYYQLYHQHPLLNCNQLIRRPDLLAFRDYVVKNGFLTTLMDLARREPPYDFKGEDLNALYQDGFRYIVVHTEVPHDAVDLAGPMGNADLIGQAAVQMLEESLGQTVLNDSSARVYTLPAQSASGELHWSGQDVVRLPKLFDGNPPLTLSGQRWTLWQNFPTPRRISFWAHAIEGSRLILRAGAQKEEILLNSDQWRWIDIAVKEGPITLEAPEEGWISLEFQRVEVGITP